MSCPSELSYSYPWEAYTAYSTNAFNFSGSLQVILTFLNNSDYVLNLRTPQVWTTNLPNEDGEFENPTFKLGNIPSEVHPGKVFVIQGVVDMSSVTSGEKILTFRPQINAGWFSDVARYAPIVSATFTCLPERGKTTDITPKFI
jgi:hypothetical protein